MPLSGVLKITPRFHGHLKASLKPLSGVIKLTLPMKMKKIKFLQDGHLGSIFSVFMPKILQIIFLLTPNY